MQIFEADDGSLHPVRGGFLIWPAGWSAGEEREAQAAFAGEGVWRWTGPTPRHRELMRAFDNRRNINSALVIARRFGWDYRETFETACQVHWNRHERPCGCAFHLVFDHHKRQALGLADIHPVAAERVCEVHAHCNSVDAAFWTSARDCNEPLHLKAGKDRLPVTVSVAQFEERLKERAA